jgi:uncharacterized protein
MSRRPFEGAPPHGEIVRGDVHMPPDGSTPGSAVIVVHGFKGFKDWGFFQHVSARIAEDGHAAVVFDFSRNGAGPDPDRFGDLDAFGRNTFSHEMEDLHWILDEVASGRLLGSPPPERLGLLGHSRGGGVAVIAAREDPRIGALVTWASVATFDRWDEATRRQWREDGRIWVENARTKQRMPLDVTLLEDFEANRDRFDILAAARELRTPWLVVHGSADAAVPVEEGRALARECGTAELVEIEGAGHTFESGHPFGGPTPELERALDVTRKHLARMAPRQG